MSTNNKEVEEELDKEFGTLTDVFGNNAKPRVLKFLHQELQKALAVQAIQIREEEANEYNKIIERELQKARESERARIEDEFAKVAKYTQDFEPDAYGENPVNTSYYQLYEGQWEYIIKPKDQSELDQPIS